MLMSVVFPSQKPHDGDPLAFVHLERNTVERAHNAELLPQAFHSNQCRHYSPRKITAGFTFPSRLSGSAPASAAPTISEPSTEKLPAR